VQNVETLYNVPHIVLRGVDWYRGLSHTKDGGTKLYGVSGHVKRPGVWELRMGTTIRDILHEYAGGMRDGYRFRGLLPGGAPELNPHFRWFVDPESRQPHGNGHDDRPR
jgi:NADH-quinone oxidoreductase subunit F